MLEANFAYVKPCEQLRGLLSNFTITFPYEAMISDKYTILPHGSVTLVLFQYQKELHSFLFGPTTKPQRVGDIANKCDFIFIIEFQPAGLYPFTKINQKELTDKIVPFSSIDVSLDITLRNILDVSKSFEEVLTNIERELIHNIRYPYPIELGTTIETIIHCEGMITAIQISHSASYSPRHLNRLFNQYLGMSMKSFSRLVRINKSIQLLNEKDSTLASICEKLGYYDTSHFFKDFKIVCNISPQKYKVNMSDFYNEIAKF